MQSFACHKTTRTILARSLEDCNKAGTVYISLRHDTFILAEYLNWPVYTLNKFYIDHKLNLVAEQCLTSRIGSARGEIRKVMEIYTSCYDDISGIDESGVMEPVTKTAVFKDLERCTRIVIGTCWMWIDETHSDICQLVLGDVLTKYGKRHSIKILEKKEMTKEGGQVSTTWKPVPTSNFDNASCHT